MDGLTWGMSVAEEERRTWTCGSPTFSSEDSQERQRERPVAVRISGNVVVQKVEQCFRNVGGKRSIIVLVFMMPDYFPKTILQFI